METDYQSEAGNTGETEI